MTADDTWIPTAPNYSDLYADNQRLRAEVAALQAELADMKDDRDELASMGFEDERNRLRAELDEARAMLPDVPLRERECVTLEHWRQRALYLESQWAGCSRACARMQDQRDEARALLREARKYLKSSYDITKAIDAALKEAK